MYESSLGETLERFLLGIFSCHQTDRADRLIELDLSLSQARTLFTVSQATEPLAIHEIAERLSLSVTAAGRNVDRLVRLGLLTRAENPQDRRVKLVALTSRGADIIADQNAIRRTSLDQFAARLPAPLREDLHTALRGVLDSGALASVPTQPAAAPGEQS